jgi:class 3 adenylate cyclase
MSFLTELYSITSKYIGIRVGVSYDKIYWGYIDNNLRLFGIPMNLSARLEIVCAPNSISCDENFLNKLMEEELFDISKLKYSKQSAELKGFDKYIYNSIPLNDETNVNIFNLSNILKI